MAQNMVFAGRKQPPRMVGARAYTARYVVEQNGRVVLEQRLQIDLQQRFDAIRRDDIKSKYNFYGNSRGYKLWSW